MSQRIPVQQIDPKATAKVSSSFGKNIVTRSYQGLFRNIRLYSTAVLLALFFLTVWFEWEGRQAVLWDLAGGKFYIFGATFWPQDLILLSALGQGKAMLEATMILPQRIILVMPGSTTSLALEIVPMKLPIDIFISTPVRSI